MVNIKNKTEFTPFQVFTGTHAQGNTAYVSLADTLPTSINTISDAYNIDLQPDVTYVFLESIHTNEYAIRWFCNNIMIQRCGHGTLAAAQYLQSRFPSDCYYFHSVREKLQVISTKHRLWLKLPVEKLIPQQKYKIETQFNFFTGRVALTDDLQGYIIAELSSNQKVIDFQLNEEIIEFIEERALIITSKSEKNKKKSNHDISFRYFAPQYGSREDQATGSAASILWPFWKDELTLNEESPLLCKQLSSKGGLLYISNNIDNKEKSTKNEESIFVSGKIDKINNDL
jgi:predicted PhzF superfamily epimerase YddE/YHI9